MKKNDSKFLISSSRPRNVGLTPAQIKSFPKYKFYRNENTDIYDVCKICYFQYADEEMVRKLPCSHFFHTKCIKTWLLNNPECPTCKARLISMRG